MSGAVGMNRDHTWTECDWRRQRDCLYTFVSLKRCSIVAALSPPSAVARHMLIVT